MSNGVILGDFTALGRISKSVGQAPTPYFSVVMVPLQTTVPVDINIHGDELTFDTLASFGITYGEPAAGKHWLLEPGYTYRWYLLSRSFVVRGPDNQLVEEYEALSLGQLGITFEVLESHQFIIIYEGYFTVNGYVIGERVTDYTAALCEPMTGIGKFSTNLGQAPRLFFSLRFVLLHGLEYLPASTYYGDELTFDILRLLGLQFGGQALHPTWQLQADYKYTWWLDEHYFTVHDDLGELVAEYQAFGQDELAISFAIWHSHQFMIVANKRFRILGYIIATRYYRFLEGLWQQDIWGEFENYLQEFFKMVFMRLYDREMVQSKCGIESPGVDLLIYYPILVGLERLVQTGHYPQNFLLYLLTFEGRRHYLTREGDLAESGHYLMIYAFSLNLLSGSKPVFEPWMLWHIWKYVTENRYTIQENKIFDLSPWWE